VIPRRHWPTALALLAAGTLGWYLLYTELLVREMRREAVIHSRIFIRVMSGLQDPRMTGDPGESAAIEALLDLSEEVQRLGIPIVITDPDGEPAYAANLPFDADPADERDEERILAYVRDLARTNTPIVEPDLGIIFFGDPPLVRRLRWVPWLQVGALLGLLIAAGWTVRHNLRTERERIWAAMARESAHQLATPLSSLEGWVEILRLPSDERERLTSLHDIAAEMEVDLDRLEKVSRRFEWIGRPVRKEPVDVVSLLRTLERYVRVRLPQLSGGVDLQVEVEPGTPPVLGNEVLLEWALENLVKNALDALAGSGGQIRVSASVFSPRRVEIQVADTGPGVAPEVRSRIFEPGVTTKSNGWGVGLSLARRIVEDVHDGRLQLAPTHPGATFLLTLPAAAEDDEAAA
jgi:signal transduction histidine kinase